MQNAELPKSSRESADVLASNTRSGSPAFKEALRSLVSHRGATLSHLSCEHPTLVLFLRHTGCTFCREALAELRQQLESLRKQRIEVAVVHMDTPLKATTLLERYGLNDVHRFSDPNCQLYDAFELERGTLLQILGPDVWWNGFFTAIVRGHGFGRIRGDVFRLPGVFLIENEEIVAQQRANSPYARPDFEQLVDRLSACQTSRN